MLVFKYMSKNSEIYKYVYMFPMISCKFKAFGSGFALLFVPTLFILIFFVTKV